MGPEENFILKDHPRPNITELPGLYAELDALAERVEKVIRGLPNRLLDEEIIQFGEMSKSEFEQLVSKDPDVMIIAFTRVCGLSDREFSRLFGLRDVYKLRGSWHTDEEGRSIFARSVMSLLPKRMHIETFLYTFYKMWEEHQKRHRRARYEDEVRAFFEAHGYDCKKITRPIEVNGAIPPKNPLVVMQVRTGVRKDLVKRAKEFSSEFDNSINAFPKAKFIVIFRVPLHELGRRDEIRQVIIEQRREKRPYDAVLFQDELENALKKLEEWGIPKTGVAMFAQDHP